MARTDHQVRPRLRIEDLMAASGLGKNACYQAVRRGELPGSIVGKRLVLTHEAFELWRKLSYWPPTPGDMAGSAITAKVGREGMTTKSQGLPVELAEALERVVASYPTVEEAAAAVGELIAGYLLTLRDTYPRS